MKRTKTILVIGTATRGQYQFLRDEVFAEGKTPVIYRFTSDKFNFADPMDPGLEVDDSSCLDEMNTEPGHQQGTSEFIYEIDALIAAMGEIHAIMIVQELWLQAWDRRWTSTGDTCGDWLLWKLGELDQEETYLDLLVYIVAQNGIHKSGLFERP